MCASLLSDTDPSILALDAGMSPAALGPRDDAEVLLPTLSGVRPRDGAEVLLPTPPGARPRDGSKHALFRTAPSHPPSDETPVRPRQPQTRGPRAAKGSGPHCVCPAMRRTWGAPRADAEVFEPGMAAV